MFHGSRNESVSSMKNTLDEIGRNDETHQSPSRSRRLLRGVGLLLIILSALLGWFLIVAYFGLQNGQDLLVERQQAALSTQLARQIELAQEDITQRRYTLATNRLEWVLEHSPNHPEAQLLLEQAQGELNRVLTPQAVGITAVPTTTPLPTPTPGLIEDPSSDLARLRQLVENEEWEQAIEGLVSFQVQFPDYERQETDQLLYDSYINLGIFLMEGEKVELGLAYFGQAETLGDLPQEAQDYRTWAELYLQGIGFYGVNWDAANYYFRDLCLAAPFFHSACDRLYDGLVGLGDQYAFVQEWCPAQPLYQEALQYNRTQELIDKINQAITGCQSATPTASAPLSGTVPITNSFIFPGALP